MSFKGFSGWGYWKEALNIWRRDTWRQDTSHLLYHQLHLFTQWKEEQGHCGGTIPD